MSIQRVHYGWPYMVLDLICRDGDCPECTQAEQERSDIFETFLGFDGDKVPDIGLNFREDFNVSAHLDVRDIFGEEYAFRAGTVGTVAAKTAYGFVKGYEHHGALPRRRRSVWRRERLWS